MNFLFVTTVLPYKKRTGGEIASLQIINTLRNLGHSVKVFGYRRQDDNQSHHENDEIVDTKYIESASSKIDALFSLLKSFVKNKPYSYAKYCSSKYINKVRNEISSGKYDALIIDHAQMSWLLKANTNLPVIFIEHNVEFDLYRELSLNTPAAKLFLKTLYFREYKLMHAIEKEIITGADQVWTLNDTDKTNLVNSFNAKHVHSIHIPGGFETFLEVKEKEYSVAMLGTWSWDANRKGLEWFVDSVLPSLNNNIDVHVGGVGAEWVKDQYENVIYHGFVDDAQEFLSKSKCIIVPSTSGSGIQIKTLDAISTGVPVVTTSIGVRGIDALPNTVHVVDDAKMFAKKMEDTVDHDTSDKSGYDWSVQRKNEFKNKLQILVGDVNEQN
jgi:glycosyltransferase involved in cell wall biosynthesis